jgi:peptide/nickel transport system substrate-binding protein
MRESGAVASLRGAVAWIAAAAAMAALWTAAPPVFADKKSDTLVWATDRENAIADPWYLNTRELVIIGHHVLDTLVLTDPATGEIKPLLATSWKWVDPTTLELELRVGVRFHSGKMLDADDVVYSLDFASNKDNAIMNFSQLEWIAGAERIDARRVRINLKRPFPPALAYLAGIGFILEKGHYDRAPARAGGGKDFGAVKPNGTGPYRITEVRPGDFIHMVRNTGYFKDGPKGYPAIGAIRFRTIKDQNTRMAELMTGRVDWIWDVPLDQAERIRANPTISVENAKTLRVAYLAFDAKGTTDVKYFMDRRVRQAFAHAINREQIAKSLVGPASVAIHSACHPDQFGCTADVPKYDYNPDKARALLKEAGLGAGIEFNLYAYRERQLTEAVIGDLARVGIRPRLTYLQYSAFQEAVRENRAPVAHWTWGSNSIPDVSAITAQFFSGGPDDQAKDEQVIKMIAEADSQTDPARRKASWHKVLARIAAEAYWVPLFTYAKYYAFSKDLDFRPTSDELPQFYAAKWR